MNFLENFVLPQSLEHIELLHYMTMVLSFLFLPFLGLLIIGTSLSLFFKHKGNKTSDNVLIDLSYDIMRISVGSKNTGIALGILPFVGLILIYSQLLHKIDILSINYLLISFITFSVGLVYVYLYRYSISLKTLFENVKTSDSPNGTSDKSLRETELSEYKATSVKFYNEAGWKGLMFLLIASYLYIAALNIIKYPADWLNQNFFLYILTSGSLFIKWVSFILVSSTFTGGFVLFILYFREGEMESRKQEYLSFAKDKLVKFILASSVLIPLLVIIEIAILPKESISFGVFLFSFIALIAVFFIWTIVYNSLKSKEGGNPGWLFMLGFIVFLLIGISDQLSIAESTKYHSLNLNNDFETDKKELQATVLSTSGVMTGEDIFTKKCSACHQFDRKVVGPPYNDVLKKYEGNTEKLAEFVLNPVKVDPAYPVMPMQGLKPKEAKAVAKYLLENFKK